MFVTDDSRSRTSGGVFFKLAKNQLPEEQFQAIYPPINRRGVLPALENEQTMLVVEGMCALEAEVGGLAVYAVKVTTTKRKKRKPRK